ncbi:MAG: SRPBCC family protein [Actinomycetota bacterium]
MADYRTTFVVDAPPNAVVQSIADLTTMNEWDSSVRSVKLAADTGPALGRRFDVTVGFYGREFDAVYEIIEFDCSSKVTWSIDGKASGTTTVSVTAAEAGSQIDYHLDVSMKGFAKLLDRGLKVALEGIGENAEKGLIRRFRR